MKSATKRGIALIAAGAAMIVGGIIYSAVVNDNPVVQTSVSATNCAKYANQNPYTLTKLGGEHLDPKAWCAYMRAENPGTYGDMFND